MRTVPPLIPAKVADASIVPLFVIVPLSVIMVIERPTICPAFVILPEPLIIIVSPDRSVPIPSPIANVTPLFTVRTLPDASAVWSIEILASTVT